MTEQEKLITSSMNLRQLQVWFSKNKTEFDISSSGFSNWIKKYYPDKEI